jgi:outer membrane protein
MLRRKKCLKAGLCFLFMIVSLAFSRAQNVEQPGQPVTLKECIAAALANNLDLSIEAFNPALSEESVAQTREKYIPQFTLTYNKLDQNQPGTWGVEGTSVRSKSDSYTFGLSESIVTGALVSLSFSNSMTDTSRAFTVINPSYYSNFQINLTQPLLRGFGPKVNRIGTLEAMNQRDISVASLKSALIQTVYDVEDAYWNLYSAIENAKVQENSLEQSRSLLKQNQEAVRIGAKSALDILNSEAEVAQYEDSLVSARLAVEQSEARLKRIMNLPADSPFSGRSFVPSDKPVIEKKEASYDEALRTALEQRPEITQSEKALENSAYAISSYRNQLLPALDLTFSMWSPGQSGVKYIYENDNPFTGSIIGKVEGSRLDALKEALRTTYKNWSLRLNLSVSFADIFSRSSLAQAKIAREQSLLGLEKQKQSIAYEVAEAIKALQNAERRVASSTASRELQEKRLAAETQRYQLGLGTIEWLLSYQRSLTNAKTIEIRALIDYKLAAANLDRVMGTTLKTKGLKFRDYEF